MGQLKGYELAWCLLSYLAAHPNYFPYRPVGALAVCGFGEQPTKTTALAYGWELR